MKIDVGMPIAVAVTTAPRRVPTFLLALSSLREAGFNGRVDVFAEPGTWDQAPRSKDTLTVTHDHAVTLGGFGNWRHAITSLLASDDSPWLLVVQDDAIWASGSANKLLAEVTIRRDLRTGFLSPYVTSKDVPSGSVEGWNECRSGWYLWGALALCIPRDAAIELLQHPRFVEHGGSQQVDAVVAASMLDLGRPSYVHVPSLVDHVGETSTLGHDDVASQLRGYRFEGVVPDVKL